MKRTLKISEWVWNLRTEVQWASPNLNLNEIHDEIGTFLDEIGFIFNEMRWKSGNETAV